MGIANSHSATEGGRRSLALKLSPAGLLVVCLFVQGWFLILHLHLARHSNPGVAILGQSFDLLRESSLPTTWASLQALAVACVAGLVAFVLGRKGVPATHRIGWKLAAVLFAVIAIDDAAGFHEKIGTITSLEMMQAIGYQSYPWHVTIAPIFAGGLLLVTYLLWGDFKRVPGCRTLVIIAIACYGLSQGIDFLEGLDRMSGQSVGNLMLAVSDWMLAEEMLEMVGTALFLCAFCAFLKVHVVGVPIVIEEDEDDQLERPAIAESAAPVRADAV